MNKMKKITLIIFSMAWVVLITWGIYKSYQGPAPSAKEQAAKVEAEKAAAKEKEIALIKKKEMIETPTLVRAFKVKKVDFKDILPVMGEIKAQAEIPLKFEINGVINKIHVEESDLIKKGDLIACLDPKDAKLRLEYLGHKFKAAQANYESLMKKLEIHQELFKAGAIIETKLNEVELELESAKAQLAATRTEKELAEEELKKTCIYASVDGVVGERKAEEGEFVTPQNEVASLFDVSKVFTEVGVVERDVHKIAVGQSAEIFVDAYPEKVFKGIVERIYPLVEGKSRTLTVKIKLLSPGKLLLPGMFSRVEIFTVELKGALIVPSVSLVDAGRGIFLLPVIPRASLKEEEEGTFLGKVELRTTKVGYLSSDYAQIMGNLLEGDLVVSETQGELKDAIRVRIIGIEEFTE